MTSRENPLAGRAALVTGGARRIGRAVALGLARGGADVVVHYHRSADAAAETADAIRALGARAWTHAADLSQPDQAETLMAAACEQLGRPPDILINSASIFTESRVATATAEMLEASLRLHAVTPLLLSQRFAALSRRGDIVNLLDARITTCDAAHATYHLGKRLLFTLTRMLALELAPGIRVNAVAPGAVLAPDGHDAAYLARVASGNPMGIHGTLDGLVDCVLFLLGSDFVTGQVLFYDGGYHMKGATYA